MDAEQVVNKIISEGQAQADKIRSEAQEKADRQRSELEQELENFRQETEQSAKEAAQDTRDRMMASVRMENRKQMLAAKRDMINQVFDKAVERINSLDDNQYLGLMKKLLHEAVVSGDEEVVIGKDEGRINQDFIKQVNRELVNGYKGNLRLSSERADISGGFILKRGNIQVNASSEVLVGAVRDQMEIEIASELFGS